MRKSRDWIFHLFNYTIFALFAFICIYPFYYIFLYSVSDTTLASQGTIVLWPHKFTLVNYTRVLQNPGIRHSTLISAARTLLGTLITLVSCAIFSYALTKKELPLRKPIYRLVVITMYLNAGLIPVYIMYHEIGFINSFWVYIIPGAVNAYFLILIKTYIEQIPPALEESAAMDGANYLVLFTRIIMPLCTPILATIAVFCAVNQWNAFSDNLIFANTDKLQTLQLQLYRVLSETQEISQNVRTSDMINHANIVQPTPTTVRMTVTMIATLPILFVYPFLQRYFVKGIMLGAIKG